MNLTIRSVELADVPLLFAFIQKKAEFDRSLGAFSGQLQTSQQALRETLFNAAPFARAVFAEVDRQPVGFALYYFRYSSFQGRPSLWLDDLYIDTSKRGQGIGTRLFQHLVQLGQSHRCSHMAWNAHEDNQRGLRFYQNMGAEIVDQQGSILYFQLNLPINCSIGAVQAKLANQIVR
ncbi:GNAT family N-acetyltransferase [Leptolyngbya sp. 7M]|uniref:GNAT family N-acetyltransferase n=1 Tax=Leptolyngbya sp. 7M TaxID=2812896 RepID=UPI001B8CD85B|nr:GNAT family N-acetyltransferase [Leptolyngbya sp. 7M]QYO63498.1 GNAT family N-acetyltransferase [Leptolyngbya sp. 7M]